MTQLNTSSPLGSEVPFESERVEVIEIYQLKRFREEGKMEKRRNRFCCLSKKSE